MRLLALLLLLPPSARATALRWRPVSTPEPPQPEPQAELPSGAPKLPQLPQMPRRRAVVDPLGVETPHHESDAAKLEELLQATIAPPGPVKLPRLPKAAEALLKPPAEVDLVISGGALRGYFMLGARHAIESRADLKVKRYSGTSAGAWTAMFMATGLSSADWLRTYTLTAAVARKAEEQGKAAPALMEAYRENLLPWMLSVLPPDAHERCSGRLYVTITTLDQRGLQRLVVSQFESNQDLFEACAASSCVPMVTTKRFGARFRGDRPCGRRRPPRYRPDMSGAGRTLAWRWEGLRFGHAPLCNLRQALLRRSVHEQHPALHRPRAAAARLRLGQGAVRALGARAGDRPVHRGARGARRAATHDSPPHISPPHIQPPHTHSRRT